MGRPSLKRPAGAPAAEPPAKKPSVKDLTEKKCSKVLSVLSQAESFPDSVRMMLEGMASLALSTAKNERHSFQAAVADMVGDLLKTVEARAEDAVKELQPKVDGCETDRVTRQEALASAKSKLESCKEAFSKQEAALQAAAEAMAASKKSLHTIQKAQTKGETAVEEAKAKKKQLEEAYANLLEPVKVSPAETAQVKGLTSLGRTFGFDPSILKALPAVLKKDPASRAGFDLVTMEQLEQDFKRALAEQTTILEEGTPATAQLDSDLEAALATYEEANKKHAAVQEASQADQAAVAEAEAALVEAKTAVDNYFPDTKAIMDEYDTKKAWLAELREGPLAAFRELYERESQQPEGAEAEAVKAA